MITWPQHLFKCLIVLLMSSILVAHVDGRGTGKPAKSDSLTSSNVKLISVLDPATRSWVKQELVKGRSVVLSNSYLFQVMKGAAQQNQKAVEQTVLIPALEQTLKGLVQAAPDENTRRLFGVPLAILAEDPGIELSEDIREQAQSIKSNPMFAPRGHYTDSENLQKYFVAMQYLAKATADVSIKKESFPFPESMLFPFETAVAVRKVFSDPANKNLVERWMLIHWFYSEINGAADLPTFADLASIVENGDLTKEAVQSWAEARHLPRINPERGLGIQPFGERQALHETVIDEMKRRFISDDTPKEKIAEVLRFGNLLTGAGHGRERVKGLDERIAREDGSTYYATVLRSISLGGKNWSKYPFRRNFFAASMTSLAEQTALMAKTSILVQKSTTVDKKIPEGVKLYLEPDSEKYLLALAKSSSRMSEICAEAVKKAPDKLGKAFAIRDLSVLFEGLAKLAHESRPLTTKDELWRTHSAYLLELARKPSVTVDVFQVKERSGDVHYYQWAVAPFLATYLQEKKKSGPKGMEMVFFEAWSDEIAPGRPGAVNNPEWEGRILEGNLGKLRSIIRVPKR